jgi:acyl carrier protein
MVYCVSLRLVAHGLVEEAFVSDIERAVQSFIVERFLLGNASGLSSNQSLLDSGVMDSTGVMELVLFLEETYSIKVADTELTPDNLDSIHKIAAYVGRKRLPAGAIKKS